MAINKVVLGDRTLIDLSLDTATEADVAKGKYFHRADGEIVEGTLEGSGGGGSGGTDEATENDVNFYDYDGTLLYSYPKVGAMSLTELPPLPEQPGLICQGWNWTLKQIQEYGGTANVGAVYITDDGKTRFYVTLECMEQAEVTLYFCVDTGGDTLVINWGDGTGDITYNVEAGDNGAYYRVNPKTFAHTYQDIGDYVITVSSEKKIHLGYSSRTVLYLPQSTAINEVHPKAYRLKANVIRRIEIGSNVADINSGSLVNLYSLKHITIPNGVGYWDPTGSKYGFLGGCYSLESFTAPNGILSQSGETFSGCYSLKYVLFNGTYGTVFESDFKSCYSLSTISITKRPAVIQNYGLQNTALETLFIPAISSIGKYGLQGCHKLREVTLNGQVSIGDYAFQNCRSLKRLTGDYKLKSVGSYAFDACNSLESIELSDAVTSIGDYAFRYCYNLDGIKFPTNLTSIGKYAFAECQRFKSIELPDNLTSIGNYAFNNCYLLKSVKIQANLTSIGTNVFCNCYNLESIELPDSLASIGVADFYCCYRLKSVKLPANLTSIGNQAFGNCSDLQTLDIPDSVTSIGGNAFNGCSNLVSINIPDGVPSIGSSCFKGCNALPSIEIPSSVTSIGSSAFEHCSSFTSLEIPPSVTSIGSSAFLYCGRLAYIDFSRHTAVPTLSSTNAFTSTPTAMEIRVPAALYDAWIAATNWSNSTIKSKIVAV